MPLLKSDINTVAPVSFTLAKTARDSENRKVWFTIAITLLVALGLVGSSYHTVITETISTWSNTNSHKVSFLVVPITLIIIWHRRHILLPQRPAPIIWPLILAMGCGVFFLAADAAYILIGTQIAIMAMLQLLMLSVLGWPIYKLLLFPLLFLWFLIPFGDSMVPSLMSLTTHITATGISLAGFDVVIDGNILTSQAGRVVIVEDCSSMDFVIGNLVMSLVFSNLAYNNNRKRFLYTLAAIPVAIFANNLRTISVVLITYWSDNRWDLISNHQTYGWLLFLACMLAQMMIGACFMDPIERASSRSVLTSTKKMVKGYNNGILIQRLTLAALLCAAPGIYSTFIHSAESQNTSMAIETPWSCTPAWLQPKPIDRNKDWQPVFKGAQAELHRQSLIDGKMVDFYVAYYWKQHKNAELIAWPNETYDRKAWRFLERKTVKTSIDGRTETILQTRLRGPDNKRRLTWHWYWIDRKFVSDARLAKALSVKTLFLGGDMRSAAIVLSVEDNSDLREPETTLSKLLARDNFLTPLLNRAGNDLIKCGIVP